MALRIIADSACDLTLEQARELGVEIVPLKVLFGGTEYRDVFDLDSRAFFEKLVETVELPTTSAVAPGAFLELFQEVLAASDEAVVVLLSSKLSATYQSAVTALGMLGSAGQGIRLVDSLSATVGEQLLVRVACDMRSEGASAEQVAARLEELVPRVRVLALLDTLEYLKKGGRISSTVAFAGKLLSIKPVISVEGGEVKLAGQARGSKNGRNLLVESVEKFGGVDLELPFRLVYSGLSCNTLYKYWEDNAARFLDEVDAEPPITGIGPVIGTHIGPNALGVAFISKQGA